MVASAIQTLIRAIYPPGCLICGERVESAFGLCPSCWREVPFIAGLCCDLCGVPLPGQDTGFDEICDDCLTVPRPWSKGRAALIYRDQARKLVLGLKHGDRQEIVRPAAGWMAKVAEPLLTKNTLITPIPLHWSRMIRRRYNQSALLGAELSNIVKQPFCPDLLRRTKRTKSLDGMSREDRFAMLEGALSIHPKRYDQLQGRSVLVVDDVMTSGATLAAAARVCLDAGAEDVRIVTLARVAKDA
ncbi:ComF family protein [Roseovarius sp. EL26]|uniref:ComF family protein n=1 Tax=Roseovarius sp. EL26 TaxID=2126672 RepID=UPI000EA0DAD9|nr:ComF family protein [Roseovarius sp. EL26]